MHSGLIPVQKPGRNPRYGTRILTSLFSLIPPPPGGIAIVPLGRGSPVPFGLLSVTGLTGSPGLSPIRMNPGPSSRPSP